MQKRNAITFISLSSVMICIMIVQPAQGAAKPDLDQVLSRWDQDAHADLKAVVVLRDGRLVAERYYNGDDPATLHDVRSAGKSITSLLAGAAIDRGRIASVDDPVERYWKQARGSAVGDVPLRDVFTMRSGLAAFDADPASPGNEDKMDASPSPEAFILALPRSEPPGSVYHYNSVTAHVAGLVVESAVGTNLQAFATAVLFRPLQIKRWSWQTDKAGHFKGEGNLSLTARDFAKIGEMVLNNGVYDGKRVISRNWLSAALAPHVEISSVDPYADGYGYFWYSKRQVVNGVPLDVSFASGNGGNKIYVVRKLHLVVAITSSAYGHGYGQRRSEDILRAILSDELESANQAKRDRPSA